MNAQRFAEPGHRPAPAHLYRYRTAALVGPWRKSLARAMVDALHAGQVRRDEIDRHKLRWMVDGRIEEDSPDTPAARRGPRAARPRGA
jgi:hypothetical protein